MNAYWILELSKPASKEEYTNAGYRYSNCRCAPLDNNRHYPLYERYCHSCGAHMIEKPVIEIERYNCEAVYKWE